jgi:hypothetical protein
MAWFDLNWLYRQKITIDKTKVQSGPFTNFPVLIAENNIKVEFWSNVKSDGTDIVVTDDDEVTKLDRELVLLNTGSQLLELYVRIPSLPSATDKVIYLYYGNSAASETNKVTTWDNTKWAGVYHFEEASATTAVNDSVDTNEGTKKAANEPLQGTGKIQKGQDFDGSNDEIHFGTGVNLGQTFSISMWLKRGRTGVEEGLFTRGHGTNYSIKCSLVPGDNLSLSIKDSGGNFESTTSFDLAITDTTTFHFLVFRISGSGIMRCHLDGVGSSDSTTKSITVAYDTTQSYAGAARWSSALADFFDGIIDELRIAKFADQDWYKTQYNNESSPGTFYSVAAQENAPIAGQPVKVRHANTPFQRHFFRGAH